VSALHERLRDVTLAVGTSVGAVVGAAVAMGLDPADVLRHAQTAGYRPRVDIGMLASGFGLDPGEGLERWLEAALGPSAAGMTLGAVPRVRGCSLVVCATDLNARAPVYLSSASHPSLPLVRALRISCSIPLLYTAVPLGEALLVDGALGDNFPVHWALRHHAPSRVLALGYAPPPPSRVQTLEQFLAALAGCSTSAPAPELLPDALHVLQLDVGEQAPAEFDMGPERMQRLFDSGASQATGFFKKLH